MFVGDLQNAPSYTLNLLGEGPSEWKHTIVNGSMQAPNRPEWLTNELLPFASHYIDINGHTIHYLDEGTGPVLLMLHGNPTWSFLYRHLIAAFRNQFRCIALDYPGFGLSQAVEGYDFLPEHHAEVVEAFVHKLKLQNITPIVQDWGGPIGLWVAAKMPNNTRSLIILNTMAWPVDNDPHFVRFSSMMGGCLGGFAIRHFNAFVNIMLPMGTPKRKLDRAAMNAYRSPLNTAAKRVPTHVFPKSIIGSTPFLAEVEQGLEKLRNKPTLLVWGDADVAFREKERKRFEHIFRQSTTLVVEGAGHYMQEDAYPEIISAVQKWWPKQ